MISYQSAVASLYALGHELHAPRKFDLAHTRVLVRALGDPERRFPSVLIAGTNGKGSTAATLASILRAAGHRTGLYTSPHLVRINERIRIDGEATSDSDFAAAYIPYIGAWSAGAFTVLIALGSQGSTTALVMAAIVLLANGILQEVVPSHPLGAAHGLTPPAGAPIAVLEQVALGVEGAASEGNRSDVRGHARTIRLGAPTSSLAMSGAGRLPSR